MRLTDRPLDLRDAQDAVMGLATSTEVALVQVGGWTSRGRRFFFAVDATDADLGDIRWHALVSETRRSVYASSPKKDRFLHRVVMDAGPLDLVDHWNGNTLDNRRANLRFATASQNAMNMAKRISSTSRFKGVMWEKDRKLWSARIKVDGVYKNLGRFCSDVAAAWAYDQAAREYYREFALLNGVEDPGDDGTRRVPHHDEHARSDGAIAAVERGIDVVADEMNVHRETVRLWIKEFEPLGMFRSDTAVLGKCDVCRDRRRMLNEQDGRHVCRKCWHGDNRSRSL